MPLWKLSILEMISIQLLFNLFLLIPQLLLVYPFPILVVVHQLHGGPHFTYGLVPVVLLSDQVPQVGLDLQVPFCENAISLTKIHELLTLKSDHGT